MHRFLTFVLSTAVAGCVIAKPSLASDNQAGVKQPLGLNTVIGCLSKGFEGEYNLTGGAPGPKMFRIISGETPEMKHWVGQDVEVLGMVGVGPAHQQGPGATTGVEYWTIKVEKAKELGGMCSNSGQEWQGDHFDQK
jgi:hypothetical protein